MGSGLPCIIIRREGGRELGGQLGTQQCLALLQRAGVRFPAPTLPVPPLQDDEGPTPAPVSKQPSPIYLQLKIIKTNFTKIVLGEEGEHFSKRLETGG